MTTKLKVIDLFCGCGGFSLGFQNIGYNVVLGLDNWKEALDVYSTNLSIPSMNIDLSDTQTAIELIKGKNPDVIIGGPPCQDFSSSGKRDEDLGRGDLTVNFADIIAAIKPNYFVMENVDRIIKTTKYGTAYKIFKNAGYGLTIVILDASYCGVPQIRKRCFVIGVLNGKDDALKDIISKNLAKKRLTVREYLGNRIDTTFYYRHPRNYSRRAIFSIDEPSPTIRGVNRPIAGGYKIKKNDATDSFKSVRPLTSSERALIQTFPEDFRFIGGKTLTEQMIGNSVPPLLAQYVAKSLTEYIENAPNLIRIGQVCLE